MLREFFAVVWNFYLKKSHLKVPDRAKSLFFVAVQRARVSAAGAEIGSILAATDDLEVVFSAVRAAFRGRLIPRRIIALGVAVASIEDFAAFRAFLDEFTGAALARTGDIEGDIFCVLAIGIPGTGEEFTELATSNDHVATAFGACTAFFDGLFDDLDRAIFFLFEVAGIFALGVIFAGEEVAVFAPFDDHERAAFRAFDVGLFAFALDVSHAFFGEFEFFVEGLVEVVESLNPT